MFCMSPLILHVHVHRPNIGAQHSMNYKAPRLESASGQEVKARTTCTKTQVVCVSFQFRQGFNPSPTEVQPSN